MEKLRIKLVERFGSEDNVVSAWNEYVEYNMETETENIKFYLNNAENIANIISNMSKEGIAKSIAQSSYACYNSMDRYVYEMSDRLYSTNSIYAVISNDALERFSVSSDITKEEKLKTLYESARNVLNNYDGYAINETIFRDCCENIVRKFVEIMK
ncbi:MAG: hypothetical protein J6Q39_10850 [Bacteroidales bacterium]|nr:hypothetical protein [Bacteroidales bacterium]